MFKDSKAFSGFSVDDLDKAKEFYNETLGIETEQDRFGLILKITGGNNVYLYQKDDHAPATFTVLNFPINNIDNAVEELKSKNVTFEQYDFGDGVATDEKSIMRGRATNMGPDIAWFKDPAGNVLSILQEN